MGGMGGSEGETIIANLRGSHPQLKLTANTGSIGKNGKDGIYGSTYGLSWGEVEKSEEYIKIPNTEKLLKQYKMYVGENLHNMYSKTNLISFCDQLNEFKV